jgi:hypothetical protein
MTAEGDANGRRRLLTLALAGAAFVAVAVAATGGPVPLATEGANRWTLRIPARRDELEGSEPAEEQLLRESIDSTAVDVVSVLADVIGIIAIAALVFFIGRAIVRALTGRPPDSLAPVGTAELAAPSGAPRDVTEAVDEGLMALASGPVDDVIVACWVRLEEAAAAGGVSRQPSETSAELAVRMLARFDVPEAPVERLLSLYRAARYSRHRLGEDDRDGAIRALREIRAAMAVTA